MDKPIPTCAICDDFFVVTPPEKPGERWVAECMKNPDHIRIEADSEETLAKYIKEQGGPRVYGR